MCVAQTHFGMIEIVTARAWGVNIVPWWNYIDTSLPAEACQSGELAGPDFRQPGLLLLLMMMLLLLLLFLLLSSFLSSSL